MVTCVWMPPGCRDRSRSRDQRPDPDSDVELTVSHGILHIEAERREEEKREEKGYVRRELRYGSLSRSLPLPEGATEADIAATYKDGVLEIRIPEPKHEPARKIAVSKA